MTDAARLFVLSLLALAGGSVFALAGVLTGAQWGSLAVWVVGLVAAGDTLYRVDEALGLTAIATGLAGGPVSYATIANRVRWSDGSVS